MTEPTQRLPSIKPVGFAQLACMCAILVIAITRMPAHRIIFLGKKIGLDLRDTPEGLLIVRAALAGAILATIQLAALRRPVRGAIRRRTAAVVAFTATCLGLGIVVQGFRIGFLQDLPDDIAPSVGIGLVLVILAGLIYCGLGWLRLARLIAPAPGAGGDSVRVGGSWLSSRTGRGVVLALPGLVVGLVLLGVELAPRMDDESKPLISPRTDNESKPLFDDMPNSRTDESLDIRTPVREPAPEIVAEELTRLRGIWKIVRREPPEAVPGSKDWISFDGARVTLMGRNAEPSRVRIDPTRNPKQIDFAISSNGTAVWVPGIYDLEGDRLALYVITHPPDVGPADRPRSFTDRCPGCIWYFERARMPPAGDFRPGGG